MTPDARSVQIQGYGTAETYINNNRIEAMLDEIVPSLSNGDYLGAMHEYINFSASYMQREPTPDHGESYSGTNHYASPQHASEQKDDPSAFPIIRLVASLVIGDMERYQQISMLNGMSSGRSSGVSAATDMSGMMVGMQFAQKIVQDMGKQPAHTEAPRQDTDVSESGKKPNFCPSCGQKTSGANFCPNCGQKLG